MPTMNLPKTAGVVPVSTSTPAPVSTSTISDPRRVRQKQTGVTAKQAHVPTTVHYSTGAPWRVHPGDWIIQRGVDLIGVLTDKAFREEYEFVIDGLLVPQATCQQIEAITGIGTTKTPDELYNAVDRLARVSIGHVKIDFTPGQLEEIKHRARKRGLTVEQELSRIVDRIKDEIFYKS